MSVSKIESGPGEEMKTCIKVVELTRIWRIRRSAALVWVVLALASADLNAQVATMFTNTGPWTVSGNWTNGVPQAGWTAMVGKNMTATLTNGESVLNLGLLKLGIDSAGGKGTVKMSNNAVMTVTNLTLGGYWDQTGTLNIGPGCVFTQLSSSGSAVIGTGDTGGAGVLNLNNARAVFEGNTFTLTANRSNRGGYLSVSNGSDLVVHAGLDTQSDANGGTHQYLGGAGAQSTVTVKRIYMASQFSNADYWNHNMAYTISNAVVRLTGGDLSIAVRFVDYGSTAVMTNNTVAVQGNGAVSNAVVDLGGYDVVVAPQGNWNWLMVDGNGVANAAMISHAGYLKVGESGGVSNYAAVANGGLLDISKGITVGATNWITVSAGILQFATNAPVITLGSNGVLTMTNATLGYRDVSGVVNLTNNWGSGGVGSFIWGGTNTLRLDNSTGNNTLGRSYLFCNNLGATNYNGLGMVNGAILNGQGVTIGDGNLSDGGSLVLSGGTPTFAGSVTNNSVNIQFANLTGFVASNGVVWMNGSASTTTAGKVVMSAYSTNTLNSGVVTWSQMAGTTQEVDGVVNGDGSLLKSGPGVLILAASNSYAGATTVSNGTLLVNGSVNGSLTVVGSATLSGTGTVYGAFTNSGVYSFAITNATGGGASLLNVSGNVVIQPGSTLSLTGTNFLSSSTAVYTLIKATGTVSGKFDNDAVVLPKGWRISYTSGGVKVMPGYPGTMILCQ